MPLSRVEDLADTRLAPKISQLPGVGLVTISGGQKPAVRIQANPTRLAAKALNLNLGGAYARSEREPPPGSGGRSDSSPSMTS
jgi:multidrug efflux pump subunit AcrB